MNDEEILKQCKELAKSKNCFVVRKEDCFLVYRINPNANKNIFVAKRSSVKNLLKFCKTL